MHSCHSACFQMPITPIHVDLVDLEKAKEEVSKHLPFHMLVNNAGINILEDFLEVTEEGFDKWGFFSAFFVF